MPTVVMMVVVTMAVDSSIVHVSSGRSHSDTCDCDSRESGEEFDLVHCRVPFILAQAHSRAYTESGVLTEIF